MTKRRQPAFKQFTGTNGTTESYILLEARPEAGLADQLRDLADDYHGIQKDLGLAPETAIARRFFLSDVLNQHAAVAASPLATSPTDSPCAVSLLQQPPLSGAKIGMLAYHLSAPDPVVKRRLSPQHLLVEKAGLRHLWSTGLCAGNADLAASSERQTAIAFGELAGTLAREGGSLRENCLRTWIFVKAIDVFYRGVVHSRRSLFVREGLTTGTHSIASTGIEGAGPHPFDVVTMDAYSLLDLRPGQIAFLNDFEAMCATTDYDVTFERGTRLAYADRAQIFLSGTASIDRKGQVVHPGDVEAQLERALCNSAAIFKAGGATLADLTHLIVYLRDPTDYPRLKARLEDRLPDLPVLAVQASVCRPQWLVEVEGIAIAPHDDPSLPSF